MGANRASAQEVSRVARSFTDCRALGMTPDETFHELALALGTHTDNNLGRGGCRGLPAPTGQWELWNVSLGAWDALHTRCTAEEWRRVCFGMPAPPIYSP